MVYLVVVKRKCDKDDYVCFGDIKNANDFIESVMMSDNVEYVDGPIAVVVRG